MPKVFITMSRRSLQARHEEVCTIVPGLLRARQPLMIPINHHNLTLEMLQLVEAVSELRLLIWVWLVMLGLAKVIFTRLFGSQLNNYLKMPHDNKGEEQQDNGQEAANVPEQVLFRAL